MADDQPIADVEAISDEALRQCLNLLQDEADRRLRLRQAHFSARVAASLRRPSKLRQLYEEFAFDRAALPDYEDFIKEAMNWLDITEFTPETADEMAEAISDRSDEFDDYVDPPE